MAREVGTAMNKRIAKKIHENHSRRRYSLAQHRRARSVLGVPQPPRMIPTNGAGFSGTVVFFMAHGGVKTPTPEQIEAGRRKLIAMGRDPLTGLKIEDGA